MIKTVFDGIKLYWGHFTTLLAISSFIWALGVKSERKNVEGVNVKEDVKELKEIQIEQGKKLDSIYIIVSDMRKKQNEIINAQNSLRESYVRYVSDNKSLTLDKFLNYMDGLEFQITPNPGAPTPDFKIGVKKVTPKK